MCSQLTESENDMTSLTNAFDNIRLTRRKVSIAQDEIARYGPGPRRDEAVVRAATLTADLVRAVQDFAELGYEKEVAALLGHSLDHVSPAMQEMH